MMDEDTYYDDLAQAQEDWATMVDAVSNRGIDDHLLVEIR